MDKIVRLTAYEYYGYMAKLADFMFKYGDKYDEDTRDKIFSYYLSDSDLFSNTDSDLNQVYEATGIFDLFSRNIYSSFLEEMQKRFDINRHLLEVGCGKYPAFAEKLAKKQKYGSIDAIDPDVVTKNIEGVNIRKEKFNRGYDISNYDMLYAIMPCEATFDMISLANLYDKDLFFLACSCYEVKMGRKSTKIGKTNWLRLVEQILATTTPKSREYKIEQTDIFAQPLIYTRKIKK